MHEDRSPEQTTPWSDVEPYVDRLYDHNLSASYVDWTRYMWTRLHELGLTSADTPMNAFDSVLRAISITTFHLEFCRRIVDADVADIATPISDMIYTSDVAVIAVLRYGTQEGAWPHISRHLESALACVYFQQAPETLSALYRHYGSPEELHKELLALSPSAHSCDGPERKGRIDDALDYARFVGGFKGDPRVRCLGVAGTSRSKRKTH